MEQKEYNQITITDIAQALKINPSTVSRALSDSSIVKSSTKKKIKENINLQMYQTLQKQIHALIQLYYAVTNHYLTSLLGFVFSCPNHYLSFILLIQSE